MQNVKEPKRRCPLLSGAFVLSGFSLMLAGCTPAQRPVSQPGTIHIVTSGESSPASEWMDGVLRETFPSARWYGPDGFSEAEHTCLAEGEVMLIADAERVPSYLWRPLERYVNSGGRVVFWGSRPFEEGSPGGGAASAERRVERASRMPECSSVQSWSSRAADGEEAGTLRIVRPGQVPWDAVEINVSGFRIRNMLISPAAEKAEHLTDALCFFAFGDSNTTRVVVRLEGPDGALWEAVEELSRDWKLHVIPRSRFQPAESAVRSRSVDAGEVLSVRRVMIGLDNETAPQMPGPHVYGLSDVMLTSGENAFMPESPDVPAIAPPAWRSGARTALIQSMLDDGQYAAQSPMPYESPVLLRKWLDFSGKRSIRSIPLFSGVHRTTGALNGWAATLFTGRMPGGGCGTWGWVGLNADESNKRWIGRLPAACAARLKEGVFLVEVPEIPPLIRGNELLEVDVHWMAPPDKGGQLRVTGELLAKDGRRLRRVTSSMLSADEIARRLHWTTINLGRMPALQSGIQDYQVRITLEDISAQTRIYDESVQPLKVGGAQPVSVQPWLKCSGSRFVSERQAVYVMGIRYQPLVHLMLPSDEVGRWLERPWFDPAQVQTDLNNLADLNINAILVPCSRMEQVDGLRYLIDEAGRRGIRVALEMDFLSPVHSDTEKAEALIRALNLEEQPDVFALFFAPETHLGTEESRARLDAAWRDWLTEQYGSLARAEKMIGKPAWYREGLLGGPSDRELEGQGTHPVATIVYRRFADDYLSRRYGYLKRFVRSLGCRQLLSAAAPPVKDLGHYPGDLSAGSLHLDFLSLSAEGCNGPDETFLGLGFLTAYARGGRGFIKPVVWMDFGPSVGDPPQEADLINQARVFDAVFEMVNRSSAAGTFAGVYSSARGAGAVSDRGIMSPLGERRPVCMTFSRHMRRLRNSMIYPATWKGRIFSRSSGAEGLAGLLREWRDTYTEELAENAGQELRPFGFGKNTTDMPLLAVGGLPYVGPAPLECANAEWGDIWVNGRLVLREPGASPDVEWGDTVRLALVNSGVAAWTASRPDQQGTVWVRARMPDGRERRMPVDMVVPGGEDFLEWNATETGTWTFRAMMEGVGDFGEALRLEVGRRGNPGR